MKELFNLGKYEFYYKVVSLETRNNEQKHILEGELKGLATSMKVSLSSMRLDWTSWRRSFLNIKAGLLNSSKRKNNSGS